jgi:hypothetical protein
MRSESFSPAAFVILLAACAQGGTGAPPEQTNEPPARNGANGEAGANGEQGPPGPKGDPGVIGVVEAIGNKAGPLPVSGTFSSTGGKLVVTVSATGYRGAAAGTIGVAVSIDGKSIGTMNGFTNEPASHKTLPTRTFVVQGIAAGAHTLSVAADANTLTDINDYFDATILELR